MSSRETKELMGHYTLLGQKISNKYPDMKELACVHPNIRELIGLIDVYNIINNSKQFQREREALLKLGRAVWPRKELTDLALLIGAEVFTSEFDKDLTKELSKNEPK